MKLSKNGPTEHRRAERFSLELPSRIRPVGEEEAEKALELVTSDVCSGGAYFQTDSPLPVGTQVKIEMLLPLEKLKQIEGKQTYIKVSGAVIRTTEKGMAICFENDCVIAPWPVKKMDS